MRAGLISGGALLALCACASPGEVRRLELSSTLTGFQAVPPGDLDGTGTARLRVDARSGQVCWELNARGIDPATAAHIHRGEAGSVGPPVMQLTVPVPERSEGCATVAAALAAEMIARPHAFYVNVHNQAFPQSAIRGQLRSQITLREPRRRVPGR
ncbi:MAG TPA: CHRD domain-containing protein [Allosphingosinicella sp.]|jgi:hypothetical protein